jgi:phosphoglycolate phosphatase-like HAD superfamily hydrolase
MNLFIDLDGTILDISAKYNYVYTKLKNKYRLPILDYWSLRSNGLSFSEGLKRVGLPNSEVEEFREDWISTIETGNALEYDKLFDGVSDKLLSLSTRYNLILCTSRKNRENLEWQIDNLGISNAFDFLMLAGNGHTKSQEIIGYFKNLKIEDISKDWIIGDTREDMLAGVEANINSCGVLTGLSLEKDLIDSGATIVYESLNSF